MALYLWSRNTPGESEEMTEQHSRSSVFVARIAILAAALVPFAWADDKAPNDKHDTRRAEQSSSKSADNKRETLSANRPRENEIWEGFVKHLRSIDREDLIPDHCNDEEHGNHDHDHAHMPDFSTGDPMIGVLFRLRPEFAVLDSLLNKKMPDVEPLSEESKKNSVTPESAAEKKKRQKRARRISRLLRKLESSNDPYVREYTRLYAARWDLENRRNQEAVGHLTPLTNSPHFLGNRGAHRELATAYRALDDDLLAILELQFYLADLTPKDLAGQVWAEEQMKQLREKRQNEGPLKECASVSEKISALLSEDLAEVDLAVEKDTESDAAANKRSENNDSDPKEKAIEAATRIEDILEKSGELLDRRQQERGLLTGAGQISGRQRRVEDILDKVIRILEGDGKRCSSCKRKPCKKKCSSCGSCAGSKPGSGSESGSEKGQKGAETSSCGKCQSEQPGQSNSKPFSNSPAKDTHVGERNNPIETALREVAPGGPEAWGEVHHREVARSLREIWNKIPIPYQSLVVQYFQDINDLAPEERKKPEKKD